MKSAEVIQQLGNRSVIMDTDALRAWAQTARSRAKELCEQAEVTKVRLGDNQWRIDPPPVAVQVHQRVLRRLAVAEARARNLAKALESSRRIGMAIGILMARHGWSETQAFDALRRLSSVSNVKLRDVADDVVYTGELPATA